MKHTCPVCGYDALARAPVDYYICPCCGTEFGYDDIAHSWDDLRNLWLSKGAPWFSKRTAPPADWDVLNQIGRLTVQNVRNIAGTTPGEVPVLREESLVSKPVVLNEAPVRVSGTTDNIEFKRDAKVAA
jgi:hypothetical protein